MSRLIVILFLCVAFAPLANAQPIDCASASGLTLRVCESPELVPLEEERRALIGDLQFIDPAHPAVQAEAGFLASQEACADAACLSAGYLAHNQSLRAALEEARPPVTEAPPAPETDTPPELTRRDDGPSSSRAEGPAVQPGEYLVAIGIALGTLAIALWLLSAAARERRRND